MRVIELAQELSVDAGAAHDDDVADDAADAEVSEGNAADAEVSEGNAADAEVSEEVPLEGEGEA